MKTAMQPKIENVTVQKKIPPDELKVFVLRSEPSKSVDVRQVA